MTFYKAINHPLRLIVFFSPKCGSTTLKDWFRHSVCEQKTEGWGLGSHQIQAAEIGDYPEYSKILFIRDPFRRLVSFYCHWVVRDDKNWAHADGEANFDLRGKSFSEFIHILSDLSDRDIGFQHHLEPQVGVVASVPFDRVIAVEDLGQELGRLSQELGLDYAVPALNATAYASAGDEYVYDLRPEALGQNGFPASRYFYNPDLVSKVERIYRDDLKFYRAFHGDKILFPAHDWGSESPAGATAKVGKAIQVPGSRQTALDADAIPVRRWLFRSRPSCGGLLVRRLLGRKGFWLNRTAGTIWSLCDGRTPVPLIVEALEHAFDDSEEPIEPQVAAALVELEQMGLLKFRKRPRAAMAASVVRREQ